MRACLYCGEHVEEGEESPNMAAGQIVHPECLLRQVVGSWGHQMQLCSCYNKTNPIGDPPELTTREAATLAVQTYRRIHGI